MAAGASAFITIWMRGATPHRLTTLTAASGRWGGAWLSLHFWEHYRFGLDREFLRKEAYPVMKEAAEFLVDFLIDDGKGHLVWSFALFRASAVSGGV